MYESNNHEGFKRNTPLLAAWVCRRNFTSEVYAPKRRTAFTAHIKQLNSLAIISIFHTSCMSNVLMWVLLDCIGGL